MSIEKKYQVFISSTYGELVDERKEVLQALLELDVIPAGMELFPAADETQWELIKRVIDDSDYYILIIAGRYGSIGPDGISYTEMEYRYALSKNKPVLAFLHKDPRSLPQNKCDPENKEKLDNFLADIKSKRLCKFWNNAAELGGYISRGLINAIKTRPAIGWVRADAIEGQAAIEILRLKTKIEELEKEKSINTPLYDISDLASLDDFFDITITYTYTYRINTEPFSLNIYEEEKSHTEVIKTTWNEIFIYLSPQLHYQSNFAAAVNAINGFAAIKIYQTAFFNNIKDDCTVKNIQCLTICINKIIIQFKILKLIEIGEKQSNEKNKTASTPYIKLTPLGEQKMCELLAVRKTT